MAVEIWQEIASCVDVSPSPGEQVVFKDSSHPEAELWEAAAIIAAGKMQFTPAPLCVSPKGMNFAVEPTSPSSPFPLT